MLQMKTYFENIAGIKLYMYINYGHYQYNQRRQGNKNPTLWPFG